MNYVTPAGFRDVLTVSYTHLHLPVGVQLISPAFKDENMFRAAAALETVYGPAPVAPAYADGKAGE